MDTVLYNTLCEEYGRLLENWEYWTKQDRARHNTLCHILNTMDVQLRLQ